jgi:hypothetical protein
MGLAGAAGPRNTERPIPMATVQQARGRSHSHDLVCQSDSEQIVGNLPLSDNLRIARHQTPRYSPISVNST